MSAGSNSFSTIRPALSEAALLAVSEGMGFQQPTPVQAAAIPLFLSNKDVLVEAVTGSGKTLAFGIPILEILNSKFFSASSSNKSVISKHNVGAMVVAPTRELATQIAAVFAKFMPYFKELRHCLFVGGQAIQDCIAEYSALGGHIIVGTPGRILDMHHRCEFINFKTLEVLVLDEADTLLDMGFKDSINQILAFLPKQRRTGLFSATQTKEVKELARAGMRNPVSISVKVQSTKSNNNSSDNSNSNSNNKKNSEHSLSSDRNNKNDDNSTGVQDSSSSSHQQSIPSTLRNNYVVCEYEERPRLLANFIMQHKHEKIIVFCATCACVDFYSNLFFLFSKEEDQTFLPHKHPIVGFHGKMVPVKRNALYTKFVGLQAGVMFTTDVAARGIDIPDVHWILQIAAPKDPAFFVHRIGRTARAGKAGGALLFISPQEDTYVELIRGRGVPLVELDKGSLQTDYDRNSSSSSSSSSSNSSSSNSNNNSSDKQRLPLCPFLAALKPLIINDRALLEAGTLAFISFLRAYKENLCSYIFRLDTLDIGSVARAYVLLRLPKIPETQSQKKGSKKKIDFETTDINTGVIPFKHKEKEDARQRKFHEKLESEKASKEENSSIKSGNSVGGVGGERGKKGADSTQQKASDGQQQEDKKRKRKKKQSYTQKLQEEWDDLAAEEAAYKKFKRGKMSKSLYEKCLEADSMDTINAIVDKDERRLQAKSVANPRQGRKQNGSDSDDFDDSDSD